MARESPYFRDILAELLIVFDGKRNITAKEYAKYLRMDVMKVGNMIKTGKLPGEKIGNEFRIPLTSIARFEDNLGKTR